MTTLASLVRKNREQQTQREKLLHLAKKAKALADEAFSIDEHVAGAKLLDAAEYIAALVKVREP